MTVDVARAVNLDLEVEVVAAVCRAVTRSVGGRWSDVDVVVDPLDTTLWVHLPAPTVHPAVAGLRARGLDTHVVNDHRVHVTGWNARLLRWRLGMLLAAVDTLTAHPDLTADLVGYHQHRHPAVGASVEAWAVLADIEATLRAATPLPHPPPPVDDVESLLGLVAAAEDAHERFIAAHLDHAEALLTTDTGLQDSRTS